MQSIWINKKWEEVNEFVYFSDIHICDELNKSHLNFIKDLCILLFDFIELIYVLLVILSTLFDQVYDLAVPDKLINAEVLSEIIMQVCQVEKCSH